MQKFVEINIPYKSHLASLIKLYTASFPSIIKFSCDSISTYDSKDILDLEIDFGVHKLEYNNDNIIIDYQEVGSSVGTYYSAEKMEKLILKTEYIDNYKEKKEYLETFIKDAKKFSNKKNDNEIICKILRNGYWTTLSKLPKRNMDTIYLENNQKNKIIKDIEKFDKSKKDYINLGIPWKRNYLLEGPPGTGKTSLIFALASKFNKNIHIINLGPKVDDSVFMSAVSSLPNNTILLLEDIDALFIDRKTNDSNKSMVSFSGILNVLDGMARKNGLITFLTTNYKNRLDQALIRPNRIDFILNFSSATKNQVQQIFTKFFPDRNDFEKFFKKIDYLNCSIGTYQKFFMYLKFNSENIENDINNLKLLKEIIEESSNKITDSTMYL